MALTPRSFFSPSLLAAIVICAGMAFVGTTMFLSVFWWAQPGEMQSVTVQKAADELSPLRGGGCDHLLRENGSALSLWSHAEWVDLAACFEGREDNGRAATASALALGYFPGSERLHNIRGYNLIVLERYEAAVFHLRVSLQSVKPTDSTLENNLAWAGLFASHRMTLSEARRHVRSALDRDRSCEALHTGMWVEYGIASRSSGASRDEAILAYRELRADYARCEDRVARGDRLTALEVAGAGVLDSEMHKLTMVQMFERNEIDDGFAPLRSELIARSLPAMRIGMEDVVEACRDIAPVRSAQPACRKALESALYAGE